MFSSLALFYVDTDNDIDIVGYVNILVEFLHFCISARHTYAVRELGARPDAADVRAVLGDRRKRHDDVDVGLFALVEKAHHCAEVADRRRVARQQNQLARRRAVRLVHVAVERTRGRVEARGGGVDARAAAQKALHLQARETEERRERAKIGGIRAKSLK